MAARLVSLAFGPHLNACRLQNKIVLCNTAAFMSVVLGCSCLSSDTKRGDEKAKTIAENIESVDASSNGNRLDIKESLETKTLEAENGLSRTVSWNMTQKQVLNHLRQLGRQSSARATHGTSSSVSSSVTKIVQEASPSDSKSVTPRIRSSLEEKVDEQSPIIYPHIRLPDQLRSLVLAPDILV